MCEETRRCEKCGEPAANRLCKACSFLEELGGDV